MYSIQIERVRKQNIVDEAYTHTHDELNVARMNVI